MGDHTEAWENKDVDFGVSEESEQVLVKDRVSSAGRVKEGSVQVSVCQKHGNSSG